MKHQKRQSVALSWKNSDSNSNPLLLISQPYTKSSRYPAPGVDSSFVGAVVEFLNLQYFEWLLDEELFLMDNW